MLQLENMDLSFNDDLCLIDAGVKDMNSIAVKCCLKSLNLHSNFIERIENLNQAYNLVFLDLSSNRICVIEGLNSLPCLKTLNLSCNLIERISGLAGLTSLCYLNLSYNQIMTVDGLCELHSDHYQLETLLLHGNELKSIDDVGHCLAGCLALRCVTLSLGHCTSDNPLCHSDKYRSYLFSVVPHLMSIDGFDAFGQPLATSDYIERPELHSYIKPMLQGTRCEGSSIDIVATPNIDAAVSAFHRSSSFPVRQNIDLNVRSLQSKTDIDKLSKASMDSHENCLDVIGQQLLELLVSKGIDQKHSAVANQDSSESSVQSTSVSLATKQFIGTNTPQVSSQMIHSHHQTAAQNKYSSDHFPRQTQPECWAEDSEFADRRMRDDLCLTYIHLTKELEAERERRCTAEEANKRLAEQLEHLMHKNYEDSKNQQKNIEIVTHLKRNLIAERNMLEQSKAEVEMLQEKIHVLEKLLSERDSKLQAAQQTVQNLQEHAASTEQQYSQRTTELHRKAHNSQLKLAAVEQEMELLRAEAENAKGKQQQLQSLLADRELNHRLELEGRYPLNSKKVDEFFAETVAKAEQVKQLTELKLKKKHNELKKKYSALEDEFRMALHIESERFRELQVAFERVTSEAASSRAALETAQQKDKLSLSAISEMTALAREQKARLIELEHIKAENMIEFREHLQQSQLHLEEAQHRIKQLELSKQENSKLKAALHAQESLVSGLREERKVWSEELAQQGVALAKDRGQLEAHIEKVQSELDGTRKRLEHETDVVRIKSKVVDDLTETVRQLKEAVVERDEQVKQARSDLLLVQHELEEQLAAEVAENQILTDKLNREQIRKDELKALISDLQAQLTAEKHAHSALEQQWQEKSHAISVIEKQVQQAKTSWELKEKKLTEERDQAIGAATIATNKLLQLDNAFRGQLDLLKTKHCEALTELNASKETQVRAAMQRVAEVETEMREILQEREISKQNNELCIRKLTNAFAELQQDLVN